MTDDRPKRSILFKPWQWVELWAVTPVILVQLTVRFRFGQSLLAFLIGLILFALLIHIATWLIPLWRSRERRARS